MSSTQKLLAEIERFLKRHDMRATNFGIWARGDWHLVRKLRAGRVPSLETADRVREWMRQYTDAHPREVSKTKRSAARRRKSPAAGAAA